MFELTSADALHHSVQGSPTLTNAKNARSLLDGVFAELRTANEQARERAPESVPKPLLELSLRGVTDGNSVLVSLLLVWMRRARAAGVDILFVEMPPLVSNLIEFTGLDEVLPTARPGAGA